MQTTRRTPPTARRCRSRSTGAGSPNIGTRVPRCGMTRSLPGMSDAIRLAVVPGDGIGPEVDRRGPEGARRGRRAPARRSRRPSTTWAPRAGTPPGRRCPTRVLAEIARPRRDPARCGRRPGRAERRARAGPAAAAALRAGPLRQPAAGSAVPRRACPLANPGDIDFVVVREGTEGPYVGNGGALRVGTPARGRHRGERQHRLRGGARRP